MFKNAACASSARASVAAVLGGAAILLCSSVLFAADDANKKDDDQELAEVQVTGTRILAPNVTSANPITSITSEDMRRLGIVNVADALTTLVPQNISTYTPANTGDTAGIARGSFFIGNTIANLRGLDPTFGSRTLTLIDGKRAVSTSNQADVVDLNIIPSNLLERMDVVTGGASATYGSGAMAGVVNLVLNRRLTGVNLDMDYGVTEAGDGGSPHVALSGGMPMFEGKGHILIGLEWQQTDAIRDCAAARAWCAESRTLYQNTTDTPLTFGTASGVLHPQPGFQGYPAQFEMDNVRLSQFSPDGAIYYNNVNITSGYRFTDDGTGIEPYAFGFRGGTGQNAINGDGPLATTGTTLQPSQNRKTAFTNFEYDFTPSTTGYVQARYATTDAVNKNPFTQSTACVRFDTQGQSLVQGGSAPNGTVVIFGPNPLTTPATTTNQVVDASAYPTLGANITSDSSWVTRSGLWGVTSFRTYLNNVVPNSFGTAPYWIIPGTTGTGTVTTGSATVNGTANVALPDPTKPPTYNPFGANARPLWKLVQYVASGANNGRFYWLLVSVTITDPVGYYDPGTPAILPQLGRNAYAFLSQLSPEAFSQVQRSFSTATSAFGAIPDPNPSAGGAPLAGASATAGSTGNVNTQLFGSSPCNGFTAVRKVWNPQIQQYTSQTSDTWNAMAGVRGRFGSDWRWESYYQYGGTSSKSVQNNVQTNISFGLAMDAVIDDRQTINGQPNPTYGQPVCRITRDGPPVLGTDGRPLSDPAGLAALAAGCKPLDIFGSTSFPDIWPNMTQDQVNQMQRDALNYAFVQNVSDGSNSQQDASFQTSGTLWQAWAGPLTGAFGLELRENKTDNAGSEGPYYERANIANGWGDAFGGTTDSAEANAEFNMPLVTGVDGINLWSIDVGLRYGAYYNKGGAGTTGQHATQYTPNWKFQTEFAPFDWVRFRVTRSRDLRTPDYRDLFLNQPSVPDQYAGTNPWRSRTAASNENQNERWSTVMVGNSNLKPEKSDTLTLGLVLSPGGWAQGMNFTVDYYDIKVHDGIGVQQAQAAPISDCWTRSGNVAATYAGDETVDPGINGLFDPSVPSCQQITFGTNPDGSRNLLDVVSYNTGQPTNGLPYYRRGFDLSWNYMFPLNRAFEDLPGSVSLTMRGTRALESSGYQAICAAFNTNGNGQCVQYVNVFTDLTGQIRASAFIPGVAATPKWSGNIITSYLYGNLTMSLSAKYVGSAKFNNQWCDSPDDCANYENAAGQLLNGSVDNNRVDPYFDFSLNGSYNLQVSNLKQFQIFGSINNLFDKSPPFTGGGISGATPSFSDTLGRAYRMGVRLKF